MSIRHPKSRRCQFNKSKKHSKYSRTCSVPSRRPLATTRPDNYYEPEKIIDFQLKYGEELFFIKWKGFDHRENTWGRVEEFRNFPDVLNEYIKKQERENLSSMLQLIDEISDDNDLLSEQNLVDRIPDCIGLDYKVLHQKLIIKFLAIMHLSLRERRHENRLFRKAKDLLQLAVARKRCLRMEALRDQFSSDEEFLAYFGFEIIA